MQELDRLKCIQAVIDGELKPIRAAERLGLTTRQVRRLATRYRTEGPGGLLSRRYQKPSNNRLDADLEQRVAQILRETYSDFGPTLAAEKLAARHGIVLAKETVRRVQMASGLWIPRKLRPIKVHQPRLRRACFGELVQIDGCDHHWFEDRGPACTAIVYVDDATSQIIVIRFGGSESTFAYFEATREHIDRFGKPLAYYSDKASIFRINRAAAAGPGYTQFGRALYELNIDSICANTAPAKGRVERANLTLQDRLVKELRLEGISTIDAANAFMPRFIDDYNAKFAKPPRNDHDAHRALRPDEDLDLIFSWRELRKVTRNLTLLYERKLLLLDDTPNNRRLVGKYIDVLQAPDGRIEVRAAGQVLPHVAYDKLGAVEQGQIVDNKRLGHLLEIAQVVQAKRDNRVDRPSTAHRADGSIVPREKLVETKRQRELAPEDLEMAVQSKASIAQQERRLRESGLLPAKAEKSGASNALRASDCAAKEMKNIKAKSIHTRAQADIST
jgi:transposase